MSNYSKKVLKDEVFWEREIAFIQLLSNLLSCSELSDFTSIKFLRLAEILIQFYDYTRADHSSLNAKNEKIRKRDTDLTPPLLFDNC